MDDYEKSDITIFENKKEKLYYNCIDCDSDIEDTFYNRQ